MTLKCFNLDIISPIAKESLNVLWVEIESPTGSFLVGIDHCPLISLIKQKSTIFYKTATEEVSRKLHSGGIFQVEDNKAQIILEQ